MVIQHNIPALNSHRYLGINNSKTAKNLEKLSSGFRINRAADDAAGLAISEKMRGQISGLGMAEQNANNGISLIQTAEGGLNETHSILQRMRELAVQSSNGTYQQEDRDQIELEYQALKSEMDRIASYTNYNGIRLLDGTVGGANLSLAKAPGTPVGTAADVMFTSGSLVGSGFDSGTYEMTAEARNLTFTDLGVTPGTAATIGGGTFDAGSINVELEYDGSDWVLNRTALEAQDSNLTSANGTTWDGQTLVLCLNGGNQSVTYNFGAALEDDDTIVASGAKITFTVDMASTATAATAVSGMTLSGSTVAGDVPADGGSADLSFTWDATAEEWTVSGTASVTATGIADAVEFTVADGQSFAIGDAAFNLVLEDADGNEVFYNIDPAAFTDPNAASTADNNVDLLSGATVKMTVNLATDAIANVAVSGYRNDPNQKPLTPDQQRINKMLTGMGIDLTSKFDINTTNIATYTQNTNLFEDLNNKDAYIITRLSTAEADRGVYKATNVYETVLQVGDQTFLGVQNGDNIDFVITNPDGADLVIASLTNAETGVAGLESGAVRFKTGDINATATYQADLVNKEDAIIGAEYTSELVFQIGANGSEDQRIGMYVFNMSSNNLGDHIKGNFISESSILTRDLANTAVNTIDKAVMYVSSQRAELGALQNRLEHTLNNLGVTKENLTAAESSIRDVDMAKEMMDFTKNNILVQAAQAMLAQANQLPQGVLQLLR